ncbi:Mn-dependent transcriptional regulator (plasmid) [Pseudarthrobacter phenanthrenivorans Sphe3]|uniref:Manganese transport regulator n=1 Tax=Pseudarthrobacter phenanthrenivorans (strain DSM 18606 / JCM 16027 / LMG 23796 / Sphe3) TaxID=930171 RepID=F0MCC7_PSEPM|nr:metal-dependent transcriptional regulator [Pseudarthrobacter phenanthrenivorans]ADX75178.1 Mn-dependent transcriptional regulator [Pseudarthrobacter phenanthrenivorans Sphe3]
MPFSDLTSSAQDYLKLIWTGTERSDVPVTIGWLAKGLGVSASTASEGVRKLADAGLVTHARYGHVELTAAGREHAVVMVRRHRLLETFLVQILGYSWDEVHDEADVLEHAVSETMITRLDQLLGHPARDPHGDPIPPTEPAAEPGAEIPLSAAPVGPALTLVRVSDADPALLKYCAGLGLLPGTDLTVLEPRPFAAGTTIRLAGHDAGIEIGPEAAEAVWVTTRS